MGRRYLRPGAIVGHVLVIAAALTCLRLGWWQWEVTESARGTAQNLGYALLWPVFAGSFVYMWLRFLHLESLQDAEHHAHGGHHETLADPVARSEANSDGGETGGTGVLGPTQRHTRGGADKAGDAPGSQPRHTRRTRGRQAEIHMTGMGTVGDDDDPELAAYNAALAALAEEEERRGRAE